MLFGFPPLVAPVVSLAAVLCTMGHPVAEKSDFLNGIMPLMCITTGGSVCAVILVHVKNNG